MCSAFDTGVGMSRKLLAEFLGTAVLVFFGVGVATLSFGFGADGASFAAGVVATALDLRTDIDGSRLRPWTDIGLPRQSGGHHRRAGGRSDIAEWRGGLLDRSVSRRNRRRTWALGRLFLVAALPSRDDRPRNRRLGIASHIHIGAGGAFATEAILTALFVFVILSVTSKSAHVATAAMVIGLTLTAVHLVGIPITGTSVNPARALGPALIVGGTAIRQVWLFIVAPLVGGAIAAVIYRVFHPANGDPAN